ncbi:sigma-70 family RNA polymerase sigma factor [Myceligenerans salitolerans]|uniref:Sigma-70 family RNA polymerase sigma factor n=1 Tax=Myceligenerans salitolerans TaxID=1230528 RepID=A0ABS3IB83_9MICO|nr:sigma-70 family RNA polymerase sigma factor [Myceligenerans salitolerans]MBO0610296.1 sigma-70 family RNA polymerase sigma factor [Myceligenerans salitolerans]
MTHDTPGTGGTTIDDDALDRLRPLSFAVAYRMLGSVAEAEDVVQEALLKVAQQADRPDGVRNPDAFVTTVTTRLSINVLRSARARRETYVGPWLPEPLVSGTATRWPGHESPAVAHSAAPPDAAAHAELADDLSTAFLVVLETLTPAERAAFLLHDVLGYPHAEAAEIIGTSAVSARQLASRARRRIEAKRAEALGHTPGRRSREEANRLVSRFLAAVEDGEVEAFIGVLSDDVVFTGDGGGNVPPGFAITKPMAGRDRVAKLLSGFSRRGLSGLAHYVPEEINGAPGLVIVADDSLGGGVLGTLSFEIGTTPDGALRIVAAHGVVNPAKLGHLGRLADLDRLAAHLRQARRGH